ncbi:type II secretion system protein GspC [Lentisalinibacter sediminis]|uniref:type II secretion system protein GspC n=1 Tax=Lentisalinibacter sediminis TaxID=2992237 RepID=UPI0038634C4E
MKLAELKSMSPSDAMSAAGRHLPRWVALALVIAIGWQLASMIWMLVPASEDDVVAPPPAATPAPSASGNRVSGIDVAGIVNAHLFGEASADAPAPVQSEIDDAPETRLSLTLKGTVAADDPAYSLAIIADSRGDEKVYSIRDSIPGGASLHAVYADRVILNRAGTLEALKLPREAEGQTISRSRQTSSARVATASSRPSVQQMITDNAVQLMDVIRPQPYFADGQQRGYRVYPGRDRKSFAALGLRPGDLVTAINGTPMNDPRTGMEVFRTLGDATQITVTVERNGQSEQLTLSTSQLELGDDGSR